LLKHNRRSSIAEGRAAAKGINQIPHLVPTRFGFGTLGGDSTMRKNMSNLQLLDSTGTSSAKAKKIAQTAIDQYNKYHGYDEGSKELAPQVKKYWAESGFEFPGVEMTCPQIEERF